MTEKENKKKKIIIILIVAIIISTIAGIGIYKYVDNNYIMPFTVKKEIVTEYGEAVPKSLDAYIDVTDEEKFKKEDVTIEHKVDKLKIGTYDCHIKWKKAKTITKIVVKDTQKPVIVLKDKTVKIKYDEDYSLKSNVKKAYDVYDGELAFEIKGELNNKKSGNQEFEVIAVDKNDNKTVEKFTVNVGKKPVWPKTYSDETSKITVYKEWYQNAWCYIAHLQFSDYSRFGTSCANGSYGSTELIQNADSRLNSILTINGCYSAPYLDYAVARSGKVYNDKACWSPAVYSSYNGLLLPAWESGGTPGIAGVQLSSLVNSGKVTDTFCFGPPFLVNGGITVGSGGGRAQRTFIGTNGNPGDIWLVVSDGRYIDGESAGLTGYECAQLLQSKGCTFGVPLDGGGSSTMMFKGEVLNATTGRPVVDFVYFR